MKEVKGNIWNFWEKGHWIVIPTNGTVKSNGEAVMGRGLALQLTQRIPGIQKELGDQLHRIGNRPVFFMTHHVITLPVKHN